MMIWRFKFHSVVEHMKWKNMEADPKWRKKTEKGQNPKRVNFKTIFIKYVKDYLILLNNFYDWNIES